MKLLGSGVRQTISFNHIANSILVAPPLEEQQAIARFLNDKTEKIERAVKIKERQIALLRERRQIIIQEAVTKGLNPATPMKDSGIDWIGQIPVHWDVKRLKYLLNSSTGFAFPSSAFITEGISVIRIGDLSETGVVNKSKSVKVSDRFKQYLDNFSVRTGDILMAMTGGTIGKASIYLDDDDALLNQRVCKFFAKSNFDPALALLWTKTDHWKNCIDLNADGGAQPNISDAVVLEMEIPVPNDMSEQCAISENANQKAADINKAIKLKEHQIEALKEYKTTLVNAAVTGKIKAT